MDTKDNNSYLISFRKLRQFIGILGILLPFMCWITNTLVNHLNLLNNPSFVNIGLSQPYVAGADLKPSISDFYYTAAGPIFTGILITVGIFLFCYRGYDRDRENDRLSWLTDRGISMFAAVCAIGIVVFPTSSSKAITDNIHIYVSSAGAGAIHLTFAAFFFLSVAVMSIINFRRNPGKVLINDREGMMYLICGFGIIACLLLLGIKQLFPGKNIFLWGKPVFFIEVLMLVFFGVAWLTKGKSAPTQLLLNKN